MQTNRSKLTRQGISLIALALVLFGASGCASMPKLNPGADKIIISEEDPPRDCEKLGKVAGKFGDYMSGGHLVSNDKLKEGAMNDLRNNALKLGANYVWIVSEGGQTYNNVKSGTSYFGMAYRCASMKRSN